MNDNKIHHHKGERRRKLPSLLEIAARIQGGETIADVAADLGCGQSTLKQKLRTSGFSPDTGLPYVPKPQEPRPALASFEHRADDVRGEGDCFGKDPADWFPEEIMSRVVKRQAITRAKAVCGGCPLRTRCLDYALRIGEEFGIWGGLTAEERRELTGGSAA